MSRRYGLFKGHRLLSSAKGQSSSGAEPASIQRAPGTLLQGLRRPGLEVDHSHSSSVEDKNEWS